MWPLMIGYSVMLLRKMKGEEVTRVVSTKCIPG